MLKIIEKFLSNSNSIPDKLLSFYAKSSLLRHIKHSLFPGSVFILAPRYNRDGLTTIHNADFEKDPLFARAYQKGKATGSWGSCDIQWRAFVACWAAEHAIRLEGDFVECGVNKGGLAMSVIEFTDFSSHNDKKFYLLDTYEGLVEKLLTPAELAMGIRGGGFEECYDQVCATFSPIKNAVVIQGPVPDTLPQVPSTKVAFLSIDMNCLVPEIAAAEYFWEKMPSGAVIVLDDYGWEGHMQQKLAFDEFSKERGVRVLSLPTGQGLIFHP
jgi:O-methyltransferase